MAEQTEPMRIDETQKRLLDWSYSQPPSERLAAQVLDAEGYGDIDPSHPLVTAVVTATAHATAGTVYGLCISRAANKLSKRLRTS